MTVMSYVISSLPGLFPPAPDSCHTTVAVMFRVAPPDGTVKLDIPANDRAPPSPETEAPGARKRFSVALSPLAYAWKKGGSCALSALCAAGIRRRSGRRGRGRLRRSRQPGRLAGHDQAAVCGVDRHAQLHQLAVDAGQQGDDCVRAVLHADPGDLFGVQLEGAGAVPAKLRIGAAQGTRQVSRQLLGTLVRGGGTEVQVHGTELHRVRLGQRHGKLAVPAARRRGTRATGT